jgi:hypothetical protein
MLRGFYAFGGNLTTAIWAQDGSPRGIARRFFCAKMLRGSIFVSALWVLVAASKTTLDIKPRGDMG